MLPVSADRVDRKSRQEQNPDRIMARLTCTLIVLLAAAAGGMAVQDGTAQKAWFGLPPPSPGGASPAVRVGARPPRPVSLPPGESPAPEFAGTAIKADVATIVNFSTQSRARKELGGDQMWGRVAGFPSATETVTWAAAEFRKAGIADVRVQPMAQTAGAGLWLPQSWRVTLLGDPAFGPGSADIVLDSALPVASSQVPGGSMTAPLVFVGSGQRSVVDHIDVKGKIAVLLVVPQGHMVFERGAVDDRSGELVRRGAAGVFNLVRLPGNEPSRDFSDCGDPCFNIGGRDGWFLEQLFERAARAGVADRLKVRIELQARTHAGLKAENAVAVIPGRDPKLAIVAEKQAGEAIVLNAHADAWFDGAGDNADGLAVLVALARHFGRPANRPARTLVLVASAGHHTPGLNGPRSFINANRELAHAAVMLVNIEHVAQRNFSPARSVDAAGYREAVADSGEAPISVGVTNDSAFLQELIDRGPARYGVNFVSDRSRFQSGETGGWAALDVAKVTLMQAPPLYHTTGEEQQVISEPGLERIARFLADFVKQADRAGKAQLNPSR
jgi:hypothetical protein